MIIYEFTDPSGVIHEISEHDVKESFRTLTAAGYDLHTANDLALDYILAKLTLRSIPESDLLYSNHSYQSEDRLCAHVATKLYQNQKTLERK